MYRVSVAICIKLLFDLECLLFAPSIDTAKYNNYIRATVLEYILLEIRQIDIFLFDLSFSFSLRVFISNIISSISAD